MSEPLIQSFLTLATAYLTYVCIREIIYLVFLLYHGKGIWWNAFHSFQHIVILSLAPIICWYSIIFSESHAAIATLLWFMSVVVYHMQDERAEAFWDVLWIIKYLHNKNHHE